MLAGGLNQRIRENSYFFTIIYFTGSREQGEGEGPGKFGTVNRQQLTVNRQQLTANRQQLTVNRQPSTVNRQQPTANNQQSNE